MLQKKKKTKTNMLGAVLGWSFEEQTLKWRFASRGFIGNSICQGARDTGLGSRKIEL